MKKKEIDVNAVVAMYDNGYTTNEIAESMGVSPSLITNRLRSAKVTLRGTKKEIDIEELKNLYLNQNYTIDRLADYFNVSTFTIKKRLHSIDVKKPSNLIRERMAATNLDRYGCENPMQNATVRAKAMATNLDRYGCEHPAQNTEVLAKMQSTMTSRYGRAHWSQRHLTDEAIAIFESSDRLRDYIVNNNIMTTAQLVATFNYSITYVERKLREHGLWDLLDHNESSPEQEVRDFIASLGVESSRDRQILSGKEIDIYCPDYKIGIEFNGIYWHSSLYKDRNYHYNKSLEAEKQGIRLIHIFENEWEDERTQPIIKSLLRLTFGKIPHRLYARQCEVREISNTDVKDFVNRNHLQGHRNAKVTLGLFNGDELVQVMSFSHNKNYEWEIIRSCPKMDTSVVGGISKLYQYFKKTYHPTEIFSYADFNKFDGNGYAALGMELIGYTGPDMKWIIDGEVCNRNPGKNAEMRERAEAQLFGAGSKKFLWKAE